MRQLIQLDPEDAFAHQHAAMMELGEKNLDEASKHLNRALTLRPGDPSIRDTEGRLALTSALTETSPIIAEQKFASAEDLFRRNIGRNRDQPYGYRHLAETYVRWAEIKATPEDRLAYLGLAYQTLLEGLDNCSSAAMLLQYLGQLEQDVYGDRERARSIFAQVLDTKPGDTVTRFMASRLEEKEGNPDRALSLLLEGLEVTPHDHELHRRIARSAMATIHPEREVEIRHHFEAALLGPLRNYRPRLGYAAYLILPRRTSQKPRNSSPSSISS